jgi:hypothetical protein
LCNVVKSICGEKALDVYCGKEEGLKKHKVNFHLKKQLREEHIESK